MLNGTMRLNYLLIIILALFCLQAKANTNKLNYQHTFRPINANSGLSNSHVYTICEDADGYIWVGTEYGLNRLNSTSVTCYYFNENDKYSLPSNLVYEVILDKDGVLWVATDKGLCQYDAGKNRFNRIVNDVLNDKDAIYNIKSDFNGNMWLATEHGLMKYDIVTKRFYKFSSANTNLATDGLLNVLCLPGRYIWLTLHSNGICLFDTKSNKVVPFTLKTSDGSNLNEMRVEGAYIDKNGQQWFGTLNNGAYCFRASDSVFVHYPMDLETSYSTRVRTFFEDHNGHFYAGTRAGVFIFNKEKNKFELYANATHLTSKLSHNSVICSFVDHANGLWLGTFAGGVDHANLQAKQFISYNAKEDDENSLNNGNVFDIEEDENGNIYVGTEKGINILDLNSMKFKYIESNPEKAGGLSYSDVKSISMLDNGDYWAATNNGGLNYYSKKTNRFNVISEIDTDEGKFDISKVYTTYVDDNDNLWAVTYSPEKNRAGVLCFLEKGSDDFKRIGNEFSFGITGGNNRVFIGGSYSFWAYEELTGHFTEYRNDSIIGEFVYSLLLDENKKLWIGSSNGLAMYDFENNKFTNFSSLLFQPAYSVLSIIADDFNNLWVSSNNGLMQINGYKSYNIDSIKVDLYTTEDKLPSSEFNINSGFKSKNGDIYFGTKNGLLRFNPALFPKIDNHLHLVFSQLEIDAYPVYVGDEIYGDIILNKNLNETSEIQLSYKNQLFTFYFDVLDYNNPTKSGFKYKLDGFDKNWKLANIYNNKATYTNLPSGEYKFKICATYNRQVVDESLREIDIHISKPFWEKWWFYIIIITLVGTIVLIIIDLRTRRLLTAKRELQEAVDIRTKELHEANVNLKKLKAFGEEVTSRLNEGEIVSVIQHYVEQISNVNIVGVAMINNETNKIDFVTFSENGKSLPAFTVDFDDSTSLAAYVILNKKMVVINDLENEYKQYISDLQIRSEKIPQSMIFLPLKLRKNLFGVLTIQSYEKNVFNNEVVSFIEDTLTYINISLDNANAYNLLKRNTEELTQHKYYLEDLVEDRTKTLEIAKNRAEESDRLKSAFLANMSHEIRTPLNAIIGFIDVMNDEDFDQQQKSTFYRIIHENAYTLLQLINDIIDFSKIEANQIQMMKETVNIQQLLNDVYLNFREQLKEKPDKNHVALKLQNCTSNDVFIITDRTRLTQVIYNLINNAIKFTEEGYVEFGIFELVEGEYVKIYVKDTGIGIDKKQINAIFHRFYKVEGNIKNLYGGTGLGLAISKHLVQLMDGEISAESEIGVGSTFIVKLPLG